MVNPNTPPSTQTVNKFANKANINAAGFNLTSGQTVILDLDPYISNKTIQVSTFSGGLTLLHSRRMLCPSVYIAALARFFTKNLLVRSLWKFGA